MRDIYQEITDKIVAAIETGCAPWHQPWAHTSVNVRPLRSNGVPYRGVNVLALWAASQASGFSSPFWLTYKQAQELGGQVRKDEKSSLVVYANTFAKTEQNDAGEDVERFIPFLKGYCVFNATQCDNLPGHFYPNPETGARPKMERNAAADAYFANIPAKVIHGGARAFYRPTSDLIQLPDFESFETSADYYATRAHENIHWTKGPSRIDRDFGRKRWGDAGYAVEELVAELGAAFICGDFNFSTKPRADHASYIANWLKVLKDDKRAIFSAASHAQRAADYLAEYQASQAVAA